MVKDWHRFVQKGFLKKHPPKTLGTWISCKEHKTRWAKGKMGIGLDEHRARRAQG